MTREWDPPTEEVVSEKVSVGYGWCDGRAGIKIKRPFPLSDKVVWISRKRIPGILDGFRDAMLMGDGAVAMKRRTIRLAKDAKIEYGIDPDGHALASLRMRVVGWWSDRVELHELREAAGVMERAAALSNPENAGY